MPQHIKDVGVIYDTSVHDIDTAMWLFDETPEVVFAIAGRINHEHEDFATITLGFKDNKTATISSNWITPIIKIDKKKIGGGEVGNVTKLFMDTYSDIVMNKNENYSHWLTMVY